MNVTREQFVGVTYRELLAENDRLWEENDKLVKVLHEVESEAVDAYLCLQHDCELLVGELDDRFRKYWHEQCENEKLRDLAKYAILCSEGDVRCEACPYHDKTREPHIICTMRKAARELRVEVDGRVNSLNNLKESMGCNTIRDDHNGGVVYQNVHMDKATFDKMLAEAEEEYSALQAENAKLREHVSEVWAIANTAMRGNPIPSAWGDEVERVSRELGIEVPE